MSYKLGKEVPLFELHNSLSEETRSNIETYSGVAESARGLIEVTAPYYKLSSKMERPGQHSTQL